MSVTVTKTGPWFASGPIRFSSLRYNFKETQSGPVKASELFRNTNIYDRNPIVPDSTENKQAADPFTGGTDATKAPFVFKGTGTNWKASLMRNSIKRYFATQSGTDVNFDMGLFTASGSKGIDWDGQGVADAVGSVTGNITRNIYKEIRITGTCGSTDTGVDGTAGSGGVGAQKKPAAKLELPNPLKAINVTIKNSGNIHGAGGLGGFFPDGTTPLDKSDPGKDGGIALKIWHEGSESKTIINNTGYIFGGGGGGEQGKHGYVNPAGLDAMRANCYADNSYYYFGGFFNTCNGQSISDSCAAGDRVIQQTWFFGIDCCDPDCDGVLDGELGSAYCYHEEIYSEKGDAPVQGRGGRGGNGKGYTQSKTNGQAGSDPGAAACPTCPAGTAANPGGECSGPGGKGGDGGDWGTTGESTTGFSPSSTGLSQGEGGGKSGPSICGKNYFPATGSTGAANIKGPKNTNCEGEEADPIDPGSPPGISLTVNQSAGHNACHVRFNKPATHLMVTRLDPTDATKFKQTDDEDKVWFRIWHRWSDRKNIDDVALWRFRIRDPNLPHTDSKSIVYDSGRYGTSGEYEGPENTGNAYPHDTGPDIGLGTGIYPIEWYGLSERNKEALNPDDLNGLSKYNAPQQRSTGQGWQTFLHNDQTIQLVDDGGVDINQIISIIPPAQSTHYEPNITYTDQPWVKSYDNEEVRSIGMESNWSQFLKSGAITTSNTKTQNKLEQSGSVTFNASVAGTYTVKAASDNGCKFKWTGGNFPSQTFVTPKFFSSGSSWGFGVAPAGFTEKGRIWPFTSEGGASEDLNENTTDNPWAPEGPAANGAYNMGPTYFQITLTAAQVGQKTLEFTLMNDHQLKDPPYTVTAGANPAVVYNWIDNFTQPTTAEIEAEEAAIAAGAQPSDRYKNWNYGHNPSGVAFAVYDPSGNVIARSTDLVSNQPYVYGSPTITCSASNILPNSSNPLHQVQCQSLSKEQQLLHYSYVAYDQSGNGSDTGIWANNTTQTTPNNPEKGTPIAFRSDDSVSQGTLNTASASFTIKPSPNNNGPMEYEFIASNPAGSATKKMTIN